MERIAEELRRIAKLVLGSNQWEFVEVVNNGATKWKVYKAIEKDVEYELSISKDYVEIIQRFINEFRGLLIIQVTERYNRKDELKAAIEKALEQIILKNSIRLKREEENIKQANDIEEAKKRYDLYKSVEISAKNMMMNDLLVS